MSIFIIDEEIAATLKNAGYAGAAFTDINGIPFWEFADIIGDTVDIKELVMLGKAFLTEPVAYL